MNIEKDNFMTNEEVIEQLNGFINNCTTEYRIEYSYNTNIRLYIKDPINKTSNINEYEKIADNIWQHSFKTTRL